MSTPRSSDASLGRIYAAALAVCALLLAACGTRLSSEEILAANSSEVSVDVAAGGAGEFEVAAPSGPSSDVATKPDAATSSGPTGGTSASAPVATTPTGSPESPADPAADPAAPTGPTPAGPATLSPIVVGNIGTYSGIVGAILSTGEQAIQVWAQWANDNGGLGGHRIELITADDNGDPARAQQLAQDFVDNKGVQAFVGNMTPLTTGVVRKVAEARQVPIVGGDLLTFDYFESPVMFPQGPDFRANALGTVKLGIDQGHTKIALILCVVVDIICKLVVQILEEGIPTIGGQIVYKARASLAQVDYTTECLGARDEGADNVIVYFDGNSLRRLADSCANQGYRPFISTNPIAFTNATLQSANTNGIVSAGQVFPFNAKDTPGAQKFHQAFADYAGTSPSAGAEALTWTSGRLLQKGTENLPAENPSAADIIAGMRTVAGDNLEGLTVNLDFSQGLPKAEDCYFTTSIADGAYSAPNGSEKSCI